MEDACKIAVDTSSAYLAAHDLPEKVIFVLFSADALDVYRRRLF
jgi:hypothetical protein